MWYPKHILWVFVLTFLVADSADLPEFETEASLIPNNYSFSFETENGQVRDENVEVDRDIKNARTPAPEGDVNFKGSYSFISADGYEYSVHYKAGKNGYQPFVTAHKLKTDKI